jgi:hypothetical protein
MGSISKKIKKHSFTILEEFLFRGEGPIFIKIEKSAFVLFYRINIQRFIFFPTAIAIKEINKKLSAKIPELLRTLL